MAINPASVVGGGGSPLWEQINTAQQNFRKMKQMQRTQNMLLRLDKTGNMGKTSDDYAYDDDGKIQLGNKPLSVKDHYRKLTQTPKDLEAAFGSHASPDMVQDFIKGKTQERDNEIIQSIRQRAELMGVDLTKKGNIYKVVPKKGEAGSEEFRQWYDVADTKTKQQLRDAGYHPELEEKRWMSYGMEKRLAQGKPIVPGGWAGLGLYGPAVGGGIAMAYQGGKKAQDWLQNVESQGAKQAMRDRVRSTVQPKLDKIQGKNIKIVNKSIKKMEASLKQEQNNLKKLKKQKGTTTITSDIIKKTEKQIKKQQKAINRRKAEVSKMRANATYKPEGKDLKGLKWMDPKKKKSLLSQARAQTEAEFKGKTSSKAWRLGKTTARWGAQAPMIGNLFGDVARALDAGENVESVVESAGSLGGPALLQALANKFPNKRVQVAANVALGAYSLLDYLTD
tara:strand:+ start:10024 stop:11376 length:1353 start_codon:yes stop_codon:yes gene_type:complete